MFKATLRSLAAHKLRLLLSGLAVVLGVAFVAGTLVFTDTLQKTFDDLFTQTTNDVVVQPLQNDLIEGSVTTAAVPTVSASLLPTVRAVEGVAKAFGSVFADGVQVVGSDGKALSTGGAPSFGSNWTSDADLIPFKLVEGRGPATSDEVAIDSQTAEKAGLTLGDTVDLVTPGPRIKPKLVGIFRFGTTGNLAGASIVAFDTPTAQKLLLGANVFTSVEAKAAEGVTQDTLAGRVRAAVGPTVSVKTGAQSADEASAQISDALTFVNVFLLVFAFVALFVGTFLILNTFSMLVAQRTRELAMLRAVGATRGQVTRSVLGEATIVGIIGGLFGLLLGVLLAIGLRLIFKQIGLDAGGSLVVKPRTAVIAMVLGVVVTILSAYLPARRASRVSPVAGMRDEGAVPASRSMRLRLYVGVPLLLIGAAALVAGGRGSGGSAASLVGLGALFTLVAVIVLAAPVAGPIVRFIGAPFRRSATGRIAVSNAARNPRRTAATAAALMIGLALVSAFGVLGASAKASTDAVIDDVIKADFLISGSNFRPFTPEVAKAVKAVPGVGVVSQFRVAPAKIDGSVTGVSGVDPATIEQVLNGVTRGSTAALNNGGLLVDDLQAADKRYAIGDPVEVTFTSGTVTLPVVGIYTQSAGLSGYVTSLQTLAESGLPPLDQQIYIKTANSGGTSIRPALDKALLPFPTVTLQDQTEFKEQIRGQVNQLLYVIYALLALAVLIAVLGIINTLVLSVIERTREIGLVRAVGASRRQLRSMIRIESVVIAVFGALLGIVLGVVFGVALQRAITDQGINILSVPWVQLLVFLVVAAGVGVLAAVLPARRAARLDVLQAVTTE